MRKHIAIIVLGALITLGLLSMTVLFQVDEFRDIVVVKRFGKIRAIYSGREGAGLHVKWFWPIERIVRYEARNMTFEDVYSEMQTSDKQNIMISMFCTWRIRDPEVFLRSVETIDEAQERIRTVIQDKKKAIFVKRPMGELVNTDPKLIKLADIERDILKATRTNVEDAYGVEVRMVAVKVWGLSKPVSDKVIKAQKDEREKFAGQYTSQGKADATAIVELAKSARQKILAFAELIAAEKRAEGDRAAAREYKKFDANPELAIWLRYLATMKAGLKERAVLVLDGKNILPSVKWFRDGPRPIPAGVPGLRLPAAPATQPAQPGTARTDKPEATR